MSSTRPVDPRGKGSPLIESNPIKHRRVEFTHPDEIDFAEFLIKGGKMLPEGRMNSQMKQIRVRVGIERENCVRLDCSQKGSVRKAARFNHS